MLFDAPPPGEGLKTVTGIIAMVAKSLVKRVAVSVELFTYVVGRSSPPHRTVEVGKNPEPVIVSVVPVEPTARPWGLRVAITGLGNTASPVPVSATLCGFPEPLLVIVKEPERSPSAVGENVTVMEQLLPSVTVIPQLFVCEKSPMTLIPEIGRFADPRTERVTVWADDDGPTTVELNERVVDDRDTVAVTPLPSSGNVCGLPTASSLIVNVPLTKDADTGANVIWIEQLIPGPRLVPQSFC